MKNYKQILEAINRGIKFALDDFDDNEFQGQDNSKVKYKGGMKEYIDLMNEVVDLGLPSKTLWCKYNLDVDPNQLSKPKDWYGKYYAWGELEGNKIDDYHEIYFDWSNYKYGKKFDMITKYCQQMYYGLNDFTDNLTELQPEDDAAYQNKKLHNFKFHIPTKEQFEELLKYTQNYWVNNYNPNKLVHNSENDRGIKGLNGRIFEGKNGNQLFIPAAGRYKGSDNNNDGSDCYILSSNIDKEYSMNTVVLKFDSDSAFILDCNNRFMGCSIRPVINL